jgi:hypothetical protein
MITSWEAFESSAVASRHARVGCEVERLDGRDLDDIDEERSGQVDMCHELLRVPSQMKCLDGGFHEEPAQPPAQA